MRCLLFALAAVFISYPSVWGCSCGGNASYCSALRVTPVVFLGRVTLDSGEGRGKGAARMVVEEVLHGLKEDPAEVQVETGAGSSCYMRLKLGERYVIYGEQKAEGLIARHFCSFSFAVAGHEHLLSALRAAERRQSASLVGSVRLLSKPYGEQSRPASGVPIVAVKDGVRLETSTNASGEFRFFNIEPGKYRLSVPSADYFEDSFRYPSEDPFVPEKSCGYQSLSVWPNGRVGGTVRNSEGKPLAGVPVEAFIPDRKGEMASSPLREEKTDSEGRYLLSGLPPGPVLVAVNGDKYRDKVPWPPTFYPGATHRKEATPIQLGSGQVLDGIQLTLAPPRKEVTVPIECVDSEGLPLAGCSILIENLEEMELGSFESSDPKSNRIEAKVYAGETYNLKVSQYINKKKYEGHLGPVKIEVMPVPLRMVLTLK